MSFVDLPILQALRTKMDWHQARQRVLAENVANADTPGYQARDLKELDFDAPVPRAKPGVSVATTNAKHIEAGPIDGDTRFKGEKGGRYQITPDGNRVVLEEQMMKVTANQMDYQAVTALYTRSLKILRTALSRNG